jgi:hypothetical protein
MTFDAKRYLDSLSMHGPSSNLSELESKAVWEELHRRMGETPEPAPTEAEHGTPTT